MPPTLTPAAFAARWRGVTMTEKAFAQSHFLDVCAMVGELLAYKDDLGNPPLLMVSDLDRAALAANPVE